MIQGNGRGRLWLVAGWRAGGARVRRAVFGWGRGRVARQRSSGKRAKSRAAGVAVRHKTGGYPPRR